MEPHIFVALLSFCLALTAAGPASANPQQSASKATASVDVVPGQPQVIVHITNGSTVDLDAWQVRLVYETKPGSPSTLYITTDTSTDAAAPGTSGRGAIPPGSRRDLTFAVADVPLSASVSLQMLLFSDGSSEGSQGEVAFVHGHRQGYAKTLNIWIDAIQAVSGKSVGQAKKELAQILASEASRLALDPSDSASLAVRQNMAELLASTDTTFLDRLSDVKQKFERQRARALRNSVR